MQTNFPPVDSTNNASATNSTLPTQSSSRKRMGSTPLDAKIVSAQKSIVLENKIETKPKEINPSSVKNLTNHLDIKLSKENQASQKILNNNSVNSHIDTKDPNKENIQKLQNKINNCYQDSPIFSNSFEVKSNSSQEIDFENLSVSEIEKINDKAHSGKINIIANISDKHITFRIGDKIKSENDALFDGERILLSEDQKNKHGGKINDLEIKYHKSMGKAERKQVDAFKENRKYAVLTNDQFNILKNIHNLRIENEQIEKEKTNNKTPDNSKPDSHVIKQTSLYNTKIKEVFTNANFSLLKLSLFEMEQTKTKKANEIRHNAEATEINKERVYKAAVKQDKSIRERMDRNLTEEIKKTSQD